MKRTIFTLFICTIALSLAACNNSAEKRAHIWLTNSVHHALSPDGDKMFYFNTYTNIFDRDYAAIYQVDLKSKEKSYINYLTMEGGTKFYCAADCHGLYIPSDRGYHGASQIVMRVGKYVSEDQTYPKYHLFIFDTEKETVKDLGVSDGFECHNGIISNFYNPNPSFGASRVSKILFYNMKGETIQPKFYEGTLGKQPTTLEVIVKDKTVVCSFYKTTKGRKYPLAAAGTIDKKGNVELQYVGNRGYNDPKYVWSGVMKEGKFEGTVTNEEDNSTQSFSFTEKAIAPENAE